jgi:hypothetical protein
VRDAAEGGHRRAALVEALLGHLPDAHPVLHEAGVAVREDGRVAAHLAGLDERVAGGEQLADGEPVLGGERAEGLGLGGQVALERADRVEVAVAERLRRRRRARGLRLDELRGRIAIALDVEVDADLEEAQRRHGPDHVDLGQLAQELDRAIQPELRARRHGQREPQVQLVLAQVVVAHARVGGEDGGGLVLARLRRARGDEHAAIAEPARVEDRGDLPDHLLLAQRGHAREHRVLVAPELRGERRVRPLHEWQLRLDPVQQARVEVVHERDPSGHSGPGTVIDARSRRRR